MHSKRLGWPLPFALCLVLLSKTEGLAATIINFDGLSDSEIITNQYPGLTFSNASVISSGITLNEFEFPPRSAFNVALDDGGPISINFGPPVLSFSGYFTYLIPLTLTAFDSGNNQAGQVVSQFGSSLALSGDPGSSPNELLVVSFAGGISRVVITGDASGRSFTMDDLVFEPQATGVPEPRSRSLMLIAGALFLVRHWRVRSKSCTNRPLVILAGLFLVGALRAQPAIGTPIAMPPAVAIGTQTLVTITVVIPDSSVIPNSVNLLRIGSSGASPAIVGQLHDDGLNGDLLAGEQLYTVRVSLNEVEAGGIQFQVSAAFRGQLRRVSSAIAVVTASEALNLPPDPGDRGRVTIAGVDLDADGIRDDVQRYIALAYPKSARTRAALRQATAALQPLVLDATDNQKSLTNMLEVARAVECSSYIHGASAASEMMNTLISQIVNTQARGQAYFVANARFGGPGGYKLTPPSQQKGLCSFNPDQMPN